MSKRWKKPRAVKTRLRESDRDDPPEAEDKPVQEATKTEDGTAYGADAYLVVPDKDKPTGWKLRIKELVDGAKKVTRAQLGRALAALFKGFRGQRVQLSADQRKGAVSKLRAEYRKLGVKKDDMPGELSEAGVPDTLAVLWVNEDEQGFAEALSLWDQCDQVRQAFREKYAQMGDAYGPMEPYAIDVYPGFVTAKKDGKTYRAAYTLQDGQVVFGSDELEEVEVQFQPVSAPQVTESLEDYHEAEVVEAVIGEQMQEAQADDAKVGWKWDVVLIRAGKTKPHQMSNGTSYVREYPQDVLESALPEFEGAHVFAFSGQEHATNPGAKGVRDEVGYFESVQMDGREVRGTFAIYRDAQWLRDRLMGLKESNRLARIGFSIDARGTGTLTKEGDLPVFKVAEIKHVDSVDVVHSPAAGGHVRRLVASTHTEDEMNLEEILALIESTRADLLKGVDREKITMKEAQELLTEALKSDPAKDPEPEPKPEPAAQPAGGNDEARVAKLEERLERSECARMLDSQLHESGLPDRVQASIRGRFEDRVFEASDLTAAITDQKEVVTALRENDPSPRSFAREITVTQEEKEKHALMLEAMFWNGPNDHDHPNFPDELKGVQAFRSLVEAFRVVTGIQAPDAREIFTESAWGAPPWEIQGNERLMEKWTRMRESATTSTWAEVFASRLAKRMQAEYMLPQLQDWRKITSDVTSVSNFQTQRRIKLGGYGILSSVSEQGTYQNLTSPTDTEETYAVAKWGGLEDITFEMIKNDDVGAVRRIPQKLGRAAGQTLYREVFDVVEDNDALADAVALVNATHSNNLSNTLGNASLTTARQQMADQAAYGDTYEILMLEPRWLLVPNELEETAWQLTRTWREGQGEHDVTDRNANFHGYYGLTPLKVGYYAVATDYWVCADPATCPTIEVGFLDGRQEPELFVQDQPNVGSVFTSDKITYKIRFIFGSTALDYRWIQGYIA